MLIEPKKEKIKCPNKINSTAASSSRARRLPAAAVAATGMLGATPAAAQSVPDKWDYETDVAIAGAGNGGMSAGISVTKAGGKVVVIEISSTIGGGSSYSGQQIHAEGAKTYEEYVAATQNLYDPVLGKVHWETFQQYKVWLKEIGASVSVDPLRPAVGNFVGDFVMGAGRSDADPEGAHKYFDSLERILKAGGGTLLTKTRVLDILTDAAGTIIGLKAQVWTTAPLEKNQKIINIKAKSVILACGGFESSPELRQRYLGPEADLAKVMGTPYNMGDGMRMAQKFGASLSGGFSTFSGGTTVARTSTIGGKHFVTPLEDVDAYEKAGWFPTPGNKLALHQTYASAMLPGAHILVNLNGKRFVDENALYPRSNHSILRQPQAMAYGVFDGAMWAAIKDVKAPQDGMTNAERLAFQTERGAVTVTANTIDELADKLGKLGTPVHKANFLKTIAEYNAAIDATKQADLEVARTGTAAKMATAPFYARAVTAQPYANFGGVAINQFSQVLDTQKQPIPRLYALPPTAGGIMRSIYKGMIGCAGTFGMIAGKHAVDNFTKGT